MDIRIYTDEAGRAPFEEWLNALKDVQGRARIRARQRYLAGASAPAKLEAKG
jgi:putative component of toxin-antitoxin plasmid stabilization module